MRSPRLGVADYSFALADARKQFPPMETPPPCGLLLKDKPLFAEYVQNPGTNKMALRCPVSPRESLLMFISLLGTPLEALEALL